LARDFEDFEQIAAAAVRKLGPGERRVISTGLVGHGASALAWPSGYSAADAKTTAVKEVLGPGWRHYPARHGIVKETSLRNAPLGPAAPRPGMPRRTIVSFSRATTMTWSFRETSTTARSSSQKESP